MGLNTDGIDPRTIKIYGSGGEIIPFSNAIEHPFDPIENAIKVVGEEDGVFNDGDYILFYGEGPKGNIEETLINTNLNPYTDQTYYYVGVNFGFGKRIESFIEPTGAADMEVNTFHDYQFHELDEYSILLVGRRWFGDKFDIETSKTFNFSVPNLITSIPVKLKIVSVSTSGNNSQMQVKINSNEIGVIQYTGLNTINSGAAVNRYAYEESLEQNITVNSDEVSVELNYDKLGVPSAIAYLDYISIEATRELAFSGNQFKFKNNETIDQSGIAQYNILNTSAVSEIWDITDKSNITKYANENSASNISFKSSLGSLKTFVTVTPQDYYTPIQVQNSIVSNQNIKGTIFNDAQGSFKDIDYLIVTPSTLYNQAERLAQINRTKNNLNVKVLRLADIYKEFNTGNKDISAIRNAVRYIYDNASVPEKRIKYLCLFGDDSVDYKDRLASNTYNTPGWQAYSSFDLVSSFVTDDFYGMMDSNEGEMAGFDKLDIAVGRIIADSPERANQMVDKVERYYSTEALGAWRNSFVILSDDIDSNSDIDMEFVINEDADDVALNKPFINVTKIHSDAYLQETTAGGERYPKVETAIVNAIEQGALVVNYFGHGGENGFAAERIFQIPHIESLRNECKLNCFVTVTCDFSKYDNPLRISAGELLFWNKDGGAISMVTTTRAIYINVGDAFNRALAENMFSYNPDDDYEEGEYPSIAEALRITKNNGQSVSNDPQKYLVSYLGDPAIKLAIPKPEVRLTKINDVSITETTDVLQALGHAKLEGVVVDSNGVVLSNYNGKVTTTIYDKKVQRQTLANDGVSDSNGPIVLDFETLGEVIFRGQATVTNGIFQIEFVVPRDISIPVGYGKVSFYALEANNASDQTGATTSTVQIGGLNENAEEDNIGPVITLFMNDENFASGGVTNESPTLIVKLQDENGINTSSGIGHDISAIIDGDETNPFVLNDFYITELDDYTRGSLNYPFRDLESGLHTLTLKAWDVYNNSSTAEIQFVVYNENQDLVVDKVLNYPNPFVDYTEFWFTHNSSESLDISIQVFTISGKLVRTLNGQTLASSAPCTSIGFTSRDLIWDGRDDFGDKIGKGTYIYKLTVHSSTTNKTVEKIEKLVIL
jgi:hypothetical protein